VEITEVKMPDSVLLFLTVELFEASLVNVFWVRIELTDGTLVVVATTKIVVKALVLVLYSAETVFDMVAALDKNSFAGLAVDDEITVVEVVVCKLKFISILSEVIVDIKVCEDFSAATVENLLV